MKVTGNTLPEWGLGSLEVATEGLDETGDCATEWNAETIPSSKKTSSYKIIHETFNNVVEYLVVLHCDMIDAIHLCSCRR